MKKYYFPEKCFDCHGPLHKVPPGWKRCGKCYLKWRAEQRNRRGEE